MKKNLLVLLVVGLMVALLAAPALADGHIDGHGTGDVTYEDVVEALEEADEMDIDEVSSEDSNFTFIAVMPFEVESDDPIFTNAAAAIFGEADDDNADGVELLFGAFHATIASSDTELTFVTIPADGVDRVFLFVSPDQWVEATLTDDGYSLGAGALSASAFEPIVINIADNSPADMNPVSGEVDFAFLAAHEETSETGGGGGGCNMMTIAPMAGLLLLPLLMLVKR